MLSALLSWVSIPSIIKVAKEKHLYDEPDDDRKIHEERVPTLGGIAIFAGVIIVSTFFFKNDTQINFGAIFSAILILFFTGIKDDIIPLPPYKKMLAQLLAAVIVVFNGNVRLTSLYGLFGIEEINPILSVIVSIFTFIVIINSFNLIDGINGLAGGIAVIVCSTFGTWFYTHEYSDLAVLAFSTAGASLGFLYHNLLKGNIFMGDTGSLIIGMITAVLAVAFISLNQHSQGLLSSSKAPVFAIAVLIIPLFDTLRVFIIRLANKKSPFNGDRNHLHHLLVDAGYTHTKASFLLYLGNLFFIGLAFAVCQLNTFIFLAIIVVVALIFNQILVAVFLKKKLIQRKKITQKATQTTSKMAFERMA